MMRYVKLLFLVGCAALLTECSKNGDYTVPPPYPENEIDIAKGKLFHIIDVDKLDEGRLALGTTGEVVLSAPDSEFYDFDSQVIDGVRYVVAKSKAMQPHSCEVVKLKIIPKSQPEYARNMMLIFRKNLNSVKSEPLLSCYSEYLGKGTRCYEKVSNTTQSVLLYDYIEDLDENYLTVNSTLNSLKMLEFSGSDYQSTLTSWAFNVGASFQHTRPEVFTLDEISFGELVPVKTRSTSILSGSFDFGMSGSLNASQAYEYYMNIYLVKKAEIALNMSRFEYSDNNDTPDLRLFSLLADDFLDQISNVPSASFNTTQFFDDWGTDVITQAVFGGYNLYIYGRSENTYENSVGFDACAELKRTKPATDGKSWVDVYKNAHSDYAGGNFDVSYMNEDYHEASKAVGVSLTVGGNMADNDAQTWLDGFNNSSESDKWALVGYRRVADEPVEGADIDSISLLYPIETLAHDIVAAYYLNFKDEMNEEDVKAYNNAASNVNALIEAKEDYLNAHAAGMTAKPRLVVADMIMKYGDNDHKNGQPQPFVGTDPRNASRKWIYYPMMANKYAPVDRGYAFESSQDDYTVAVDTKDEYWYYAMASENDCDGIVEIQFEIDGDDAVEYYTRRGDCAHEGSNDTNKANYLWVKYYDPSSYDASQKITAVGFYDKNDDVKQIIASTGGSELKRNATEGETREWESFWQDREARDKPWNEGGADIHYHQFYPVYVRKDLPIKRMNESNVCHPLKWGESE